MATSQKKKKTTATRERILSKAFEPAWDYSGATISNGLDGYLVVWRHTMDDVPVGLFKTKEAAIEAAEKMSFRVANACAKRLDIDCRTPVCFAVVSFAFGQPGQMIIVDRNDDGDRPVPLPR
jgi:hypothetical protein